MNTIVLLLGLIALTEVTRLFLTHKPQTKKTHFKQKLDGVAKMIWDLEFKKFKTEEIKEDIRNEYDGAKSSIHTIDAQIKNWPKGKPEADKKQLEDRKVLAERDVKRYEAQMSMLDTEVKGAKPSADFPDGVTGIDQQIDSMNELKVMLKDWIKVL